MLTGASVIAEVGVPNELGECVLWDNLLQVFWWVDIEGRALFKYNPETANLQSWKTPYRLASFALVDDDSRLLAAFDRGVALYDIYTGSLDWLTSKSFLPIGHRLNDGRVDRDGNYCVGSMIEDKDNSTSMSTLFRINHNHEISVLRSNLQISNGLAWSPDGSTMYHTDSPSRTITVCDYSDQFSEEREPEVFASTAHGAYPDGATVDAAGQLWSANWGGSSVTCYSATGEKLTTIELPVSQPTCVAFGGPDLNLLMVTSARQGLSAEQLAAEPSAGKAFLIKTNERGLVEPRFKSNL